MAPRLRDRAYVDYSSLLNAVKPAARTDQYKILAALFFLDAHKVPVIAKQVSTLLHLHFRSGAPKNVSDKLRKYSAYVEPTGVGRPLQWRLTPNGVAKLASLSGRSLEAPTRSLDFETDIGVVCALEHPEFAAVVNALGGPTAWGEVGSARYTHIYRKSALTTSSGQSLSVIGTTATSMGLTAAAIATTQLVLQFCPRIVVMIGIAAGTRQGHKEYGDVLVADPSVDYNSGKVAMANGVREFLPDPYPLGLNARLRSVLQKYRGAHPVLTQIRNGWNGTAPETAPRVHVGPLGAADQVIDDESRVLEIQRSWRKLIGVEMETYGVYRACHESPEPKPRFVSFKSVCDFAAAKSDSWQEYAAYVAATFAFEFLKSEWNALWPQAQPAEVSDDE